MLMIEFCFLNPFRKTPFFATKAQRTLKFTDCNLLNLISLLFFRFGALVAFFCYLLFSEKAQN